MALADDGAVDGSEPAGAYLAIGASLFPAIWMYEHDAQKFSRNAEWLTGRIHYVRLFGHVGPSGGWADRLVNALDPGYEVLVREALAALWDDFDLRAAVTIFAGVDGTTRADRERIVDGWATIASAMPETIQYFELANESWQNFPDRDELKALCRRLRAQVPHLVGMSSISHDDSPERHALYDSSGATLLTEHPDRSEQQQPEGKWRYVRQMWGIPPDLRLPTVQNEGKGPGSSTPYPGDDSPIRQAMFAANSWIAGCAGFVFHCGAGIRSGGTDDLARVPPRATDYDVEPMAGPCLDAIRLVRDLLPPDTPTWAGQNWYWPGHPFQIAKSDMRSENGDTHGCWRAFAITRGTRFIVAVGGLKHIFPMQAKSARRVTIVDPTRPDRKRNASLTTEESLMLYEADGEGQLVISQ